MILIIFLDVDCGEPDMPQFSEIVFDTEEQLTHLGTEITYSCSKSYQLKGSKTRVCLQAGHWSGETPTCEGKVKKKSSIFILVVDKIERKYLVNTLARIEKLSFASYIKQLNTRLLYFKNFAMKLNLVAKNKL